MDFLQNTLIFVLDLLDLAFERLELLLERLGFSWPLRHVASKLVGLIGASIDDVMGDCAADGMVADHMQTEAFHDCIGLGV